MAKGPALKTVEAAPTTAGARTKNEINEDHTRGRMKWNTGLLVSVTGRTGERVGSTCVFFFVGCRQIIVLDRHLNQRMIAPRARVPN